ncbi:hypothetical protein ACIRS3_00110 [Streptomyces virginiae]|uniref:hypothetical protein n=1 Tax=Streptomyces virginiae TaxID=1961 RepID=UPI003802F5F0
MKHDAAGQVQADTVNGRTTTYAHNGRRRRTFRRSPSGAESHLAFNASGMASYTAGEHTCTFEHDAMSRESARTLDNQMRLGRGWEPVGRTAQQTTASDGASLLERSFTYQADGSPTAVDDSGLRRRRVSLNAAGHSTAVNATDKTEQYAYNTAGPRRHRCRRPRRLSPPLPTVLGYGQRDDGWDDNTSADLT